VPEAHLPISPNGRQFQGRSAFDAGFLKAGLAGRLIDAKPGYRYIRNTDEELANVAEKLHERTRDISSWRRATVAPAKTASQGVVFPLRQCIRLSAFL
jgi:hypothetical protein